MAERSCDPEFVAFAGHLADEAGKVVRRYFRTQIPVDDKADQSPVTVADRETERRMRDLIARRYPDHGIAGEEFGEEGMDRDFVWSLDPIDGTRSFISGSPLFGTLISLVHRGQPILGVIDHPMTGERWVGANGQAHHNGQPIGVRDCTRIEDATCYSYGIEALDGDAGAILGALFRRVKLMRFSADCYAYGLLALGFVDLVVEDGLKPHDFCALQPVVEGAGGIMTDWQGKRLTIGSDGRVIAAGDRRLHETVLALVRD
ncbi:histidinol-phosphatase [Oceanibacterium hippocampi]|uniref:Histidinol-phosphatase n=1 Tax=Oceanibacterium hippocampi TaxID=745714 RepID=A0A1Y5RTH7_9PROT|nr:histidinol-phosphatase [Oceanibacterium hippocampi]SLN25207.1 Inositol-1-monophosphatase [Oceanibacterium hippocampi]